MFILYLFTTVPKLISMKKTIEYILGVTFENAKHM